MDFEGKVVLITGAVGGIGKETTRLFNEQGAKLALVDLDQNALESVAEELNLQDYILIAADVSKEDQVSSFVQTTKEKYGRIDVFFNNAAVFSKERMIISKTLSEDFENLYNVNVKGVFYGLKYVMAVMMVQKSGCILNTSSTAGLGGIPGASPYVSCKHAVIGLTKTAALEGAERGVRVNAICPGYVNTPLNRLADEKLSREDLDRKRSRIPMKRYVEPIEVGYLVLFLSSDKASMITGSSYLIDGGTSAIM